MFEVSTKVDYALLILAELAQVWPNTYVSLADIAEKKHVSSKYLSQVVIPLHQAGLVVSREGKFGGYALAQAPEKISVRAVVEAVDGPLQLVRCMSTKHNCPAETHCSTQPLWQNLKKDIYQLLAEKSLADMTNRSHSLWTLTRQPIWW